jgi:hypothetical protein
MTEQEHQAAVAAFIRSKGITRCPTACVLPTHGTVSAADRAALRRADAIREQRRLERLEEIRRHVFAVN